MNAWQEADAAVPLDMDGPVGVPFTPFEETWLEQSIAARFDTAASQHAARTAVADGTHSLSYAQLRQRAWSLAPRIAAACPPQQPLGLLLPHGVLLPLAELACLAAGRACVPMDLHHPAARLADIAQDAGLGAVLVRDRTHARYVPPGVPWIALEDDAGEEAPAPVFRYAPDAPAIILYTSGSSGRPKGICNSQGALLQRVREATNACHIHPDDRVLLLSSPGTIAGQREMFAALLNGAQLHIVNPQGDGVSAVLETMRRERVTLCYAVPALLRVLLRLPGARDAFAHMRVVRVGGDVTLAADLALFRSVVPPSCRFFASFSSTETPAVFQWFVPPDWEADGARVPVGHARPGIAFRVQDEAGRSVPPGGIGELVVRSRYLALGQWQEGRLTQGALRADPEDPSQRLFATGDLVRQRADGLWELFGRKDRQIKMRGVRVDTGEVESLLRGCKGVADVAVIARQRGEETVALVAFVAFDGSTPADLSALKDTLHAHLPASVHPVELRVLPSIPQLPGFKPDVAALKALDKQRQEEMTQNDMPVASAVPADAIEDAVRQAWSSVLGTRSCIANRSWEESEGDSLKAVELRFHLEERLGIRLPFELLQEDTTPQSLARSLRALDATARTEVHEAPVVYLFPGIQDDDPPLARFRMAFSEQVRFRLVDYPGWRETAASGGSLAALVDAVVAKILAEPPVERYRLAGYSFGGVIAFEVAHRLLAAGHRVDFLGLLDTRRWDLTADGKARFHRFLDEVPNPRADWAKALVAALVRRRRYGVLDAAERLLMLRPGRAALWLRRRITRELRYCAFLQWRPAPLAVPTELYLSNDRWPGEPEDYGWSSMCHPLRLVPVGGDHATVIQSPQRETLCRAFLAALRARTRTA